MSELKIRTRATGASAVLPPGSLLGEVKADVSGEKAKDDPSRVETFTIRLTIAGDLGAAVKQRIVEDAEAICTVSNTLRGAPVLHATLG
ncbi:MAG: OsmC family protein [Mesorhizobium sp.]|nr:MAG: OsmC family protein [Mesorhizobium sp.]